MRPEALAGLQADLFARITGLPVGDPSRAAAAVVGDGRASAEQRVQVYATMYRLRIAEALESQFPRVARALGPEAFAEAAVAFVADAPSRHPSFRELGRGFADWLARRPPGAPDDLTALAALARLEWARTEVFDLADQAVLTVDALRALSPDQFAELPLRLVDAHRFVDVDRTVLETWARLRDPADGAAEPAAASGDATGSALVWRQDVAAYHRGLGASERSTLEQLAGGTTFGAVCERLSDGRSDQEAAAQAFTWLSTWALDGLLAT